MPFLSHERFLSVSLSPPPSHPPSLLPFLSLSLTHSHSLSPSEADTHDLQSFVDCH